ncbi:MAG TPA: hypothetical protein VFX16_13545 [Pseudonocardiaceae bacterium]|nr:hypothetical protein [Pseudonocardiaceae bacterium]
MLTTADTRHGHLRAGAAMQRAWLTAIARGLVASVVTQPWHLPEVRAAAIDQLGLDGVPLAMLRVGRPMLTTDVPVPRDHRP